MSEYPWRDKEKIEELYCEKRLSLREVGDELGCSYDCVMRWLDRHGIPRRDKMEMAIRHRRKKPAGYRTNTHGYEQWRNTFEGNEKSVYVHRLLAVSKFGFEAMKNMDVHHKNGLKWDNRVENLELKSRSDHLSQHLSERVEHMEFDEEGNISGWSDVSS